MLCTVLDCTPNDLMTPNLTRSSLADPAHPKPPTATAMTRTATAMAAGHAARQWHPGSASLGRARRCRNPHRARTLVEIIPAPGPNAAAAAAAQVQPLPAQPSRLDQPPRRLLLRLPARRTLQPTLCRTCGSQRDYFSQGLCSRCHPRSPEHIGSCKGCLAWGVYPRHNWTCWSCRWWSSHYPKGTCAFCGRDSHVSDQRACRLCLENARLQQEPGRAPDLPPPTSTASSCSSPTWSSSGE